MARNHGLAVASGDVIVFADNDVVFTTGWQRLLIGHLCAWPDIGAVGPVSDYVADHQKVHRLPGPGAHIDGFAAAIQQERAGDHGYCNRLLLFFMAVRRTVIEQVGGFDPAYGKWGLEDDDWSLRARMAGYQLRIARDCFIQHIGSQTSRTANLDYDRLLLRNWEVFKQKWGLDPALPYGTPVDRTAMAARPFESARHFVPYGAPDRRAPPPRLLVPVSPERTHPIAERPCATV
jgi:GT2 family glycosyltransferase